MKKYFLSIIFFLIGVGCTIAYNIIGCKVAPDGTLVEQFFLIPLTLLFVTISIVLAVIVTMVSFYRNAKKNKKSKN